MSDKAFNVIRFLSEVAITAAGVCYKAIAEIWGLPYGEAVLATCAAVSTFLGIFTEWQRISYNKKGEKHEEDLLESEQSDRE
jgi:glutamate mutase epsilon subunit